MLTATLLLLSPREIQAQGSGLVAHLPLDEGTGTTSVDLSGNGNTGTLVNGPIWTTGRLNGALSFDGVNDELIIGNSTSINTVTSGVTVAAWVSRTTNQGSWATVVSRQLGTANLDHWWLGFTETGRYRWLVNTSNGYSQYVGLGGSPR